MLFDMIWPRAHLALVIWIFLRERVHQLSFITYVTIIHSAYKDHSLVHLVHYHHSSWAAIFLIATTFVYWCCRAFVPPLSFNNDILWFDTSLNRFFKSDSRRDFSLLCWEKLLVIFWRMRMWLWYMSKCISLSLRGERFIGDKVGRLCDRARH
jgi:hypothetical protein